MATWRRKRKRQGWGSGLEYAWNSYLEEESMAVAGSATTAYECKMQEYRLVTVATTRLRTDCATVSDAQDRLQRGETVVVAGSDMAQLRMRLASFGIDG